MLVRTVTNTLPATGLPASAQYFPTVVCGALIAVFALAELIYGAPTPDEASPEPGRE